MSNIDEIMGAVGRHGDDCIRNADAASESFEGLRDLIAAALADAERKGAEQMREVAAAEIERLKAAQSMAPASAAHGEIALRWRVQADGLYAVYMMVSNLSTEAQAHAAMAYVQSLFAGDEMAGRH